LDRFLLELLDTRKRFFVALFNFIQAALEGIFATPQRLSSRNGLFVVALKFRDPGTLFLAELEVLRGLGF
jgi:hypothetical protein